MQVCFICFEKYSLCVTKCCNQHVHASCVCKWMDIKIKMKESNIYCPYCKSGFICEFWNYLCEEK